MFDGYHVSGFDVIWKPYLLSLDSHVLPGECFLIHHNTAPAPVR